MTAQIPDSFLLEDKKFSIVGVHGGALFNPLDHGMQPLPRITSCWRGFACLYKTSARKLLLDILQVNLGREGRATNHVRPVFMNSSMFDNTYKDLNLPTNYTNELMVAEGFIHELYVHMGFHPAWKYETVVKLAVSQGTVLDAKDVSQERAELRGKMMSQPPVRAESPASHRDASREEVEKWIAFTFRQDAGSLDENN